jgi:hypothetical protein
MGEDLGIWRPETRQDVGSYDNYDVLRQYHTADVKVDMAGVHTEGVEPHLAAIRQALDFMPDARVIQHSPIVIGGDWSCVVGVLGGGASMATVARYRDAAVAEEYVLLRKTMEGEPALTVAGTPLVDIANVDESVRPITGAVPGWSCTFGKTAEGKYVAIFTGPTTEGNAPLVYTE